MAHIGRGIDSRGEAIGMSECFGRMDGDVLVLFLDAERGERAVGYDEGGFRIFDPADELLGVLSAHLVVLRLHSPGAIDRRALLHDVDLGVRNEPEDACSRRADLLRTQMTSCVIRHFPERSLELADQRLLSAKSLE